MRTAMASVIAALLATPSLFAQAWVPAKGEGTVAIVYQTQLVRASLTISRDWSVDACTPLGKLILSCTTRFSPLASTIQTKCFGPSAN